MPWEANLRFRIDSAKEWKMWKLWIKISGAEKMVEVHKAILMSLLEIY
jgi:hypothetical protein